jgi:hypothetical protein
MTPRAYAWLCQSEIGKIRERNVDREWYLKRYSFVNFSFLRGADTGVSVNAGTNRFASRAGPHGFVQSKAEAERTGVKRRTLPCQQEEESTRKFRLHS